MKPIIEMNNYEPLRINWRGKEYKVMFSDEFLKVLRAEVRDGERLSMTFVNEEETNQFNKRFNDTKQ